MRFLLAVLVNEIQGEIHADEGKVDKIERKYVIQASAHNLARNARQIAHHNRDREYDALALGGFGSYALIHRNGPRESETNQHNAFKNRYHNENSFFSQFVLNWLVYHHYTLDNG